MLIEILSWSLDHRYTYGVLLIILNSDLWKTVGKVVAAALAQKFGSNRRAVSVIKVIVKLVHSDGDYSHAATRTAYGNQKAYSHLYLLRSDHLPSSSVRRQRPVFG